jgi:antirestriction protein
LLSEHYHGVYPSEEIFAELFAQDTMAISDNIVCYIDYEKMARDLFVDDFFSIKVNGKTHVFSFL